MDKQQELAMNEMCILVDDNDNIIGKATKRECHLINPTTNEALLHRAFSVFAFDKEKNLLLQKRSKHKVTFPLLWANTCCSHPLYCDNEINGELGSRVAAKRRLQIELGINNIDISKLIFLTKVHYKATSSTIDQNCDAIWGEHEIDYILIIKDLEPSDVTPNNNEIDEISWISKFNFKNFLNINSQYLTPWFKLIANTLLPNWWDHLDNIENFVDHNIHQFVS